MKTRLIKIFLIVVLVPIFLFLFTKEVNAGCTLTYSQYLPETCPGYYSCGGPYVEGGPVYCYKCSGEWIEWYECDNCGQCGGGGGPVPEPPAGMITISPDLSDPDNQKYFSTNLSAYPGYVGQFFEGPKATNSKIAGCWFGVGGTCYKSWGSISKRWDWRAPGNFIGFHVFDTYNCNPSRDGDDCNYTIYFKAPDNYLITRIEFDYEKHVNYGGQDRVIFGLSPEVRIGISEQYLEYDDDQQIPVNGPDYGHLSFNMEPATKYIYFYAHSRTADADEYMWAMLRDVKFDLIKVSQTEKPVVDVVANIYEIGKEITNPLDPKHEADCPKVDDLCVEKVCLRNENANWEQCSANNKWIYLSALNPSVIHGYPWTLPSGQANPTVYLKACTYWGDNYCTIFSDSINYALPKGRITGNVYQNPDGVCSNPQTPDVCSGWSVTCAGIPARKDSTSQFTCVDAVGSTQLPYGTYVMDLVPPSGCQVITGGGCQQDPTSIQLDLPSETVTPPFYLWQGAQAWFQTQGGDVHSGGSISSKIPATAAEKYFSLNGSGGYPGVVSYNGSSADFTPAGSVSRDPPFGWLAETSFSKKSYNYFYQLLGSPTLEIPPPEIKNEDLPSTDQVKAFSGDVQTGNEWQLGTKRIAIITNGKFLIKHRILIDSGGSLVVIAQGGIGISKNLIATGTGGNRLQGIFITDGTFYTSVEEDFSFTPADSNKILVIDGAVIAGGVNLKRDFNALGGGDYENETTPTETFRYDPSLFMNIHPDLWKSAFTWQELAP